MLAEFSASRRPDRRYKVVKRLALAFILAFPILLLPLTALAEDQPFKTVVDGIVPKTTGLTIHGSAGGCDLLLQNQTGQDVILFDLSKPPKPFRFAAQPKAASPKPPIPVHLTGAWPCASLPAVTEDQRWNHAEATVVNWTIKGAVGAVTFVISARSLYDPALDPSAEWTFYLRVAVGALVVGSLLIAAPYLFKRRREILGNTKHAA
jgi:hypothetical protein